MSAPASGGVKLATRSTRAGAISMPMVLPAPAPGGQTTRFTPSLRATCQAWTGPAPPVASSAYSDGTRPRSAIAHARGAGHVLVHHVVHAEGARDPARPRAPTASVPNALSVAARSIFIAPPRKKSALR